MGIFDRFPYSSTHEMNLDFMLGKATEIAESLQQVTTGLQQMTEGLAQIASQTAQATEAAEESQQYAQASQSHSNQAMVYKTAAENAANRAEEALSNMGDSETVCTEAAARAEAARAAVAESASAASSSAASANLNASQAATSAGSAANSATDAARSAQNANVSATNASLHASNAETSATNAATSATNAATSATNAATSATNAGTSANAAAASKEQVDALVESLPEDFTDLNNIVNTHEKQIVDGMFILTAADFVQGNWSMAAPSGTTTTWYKDIRTSKAYDVQPGDRIITSPGANTLYMRFSVFDKNDTLVQEYKGYYDKLTITNNVIDITASGKLYINVANGYNPGNSTAIVPADMTATINVANTYAARETYRMLMDRELSVPWECEQHRGYNSSTVHSNTLPAYYRAWKNGADSIETDVRKASDGVYIISHDPTITVDGTTYTIEETPSTTLTNLVLSTDPIYGECKVPLFADVLKLCAYTGMKCNIDCKDVVVAEIAQMVINAGMNGKCVYSSVPPTVISNILAIDPWAGFCITYSEANVSGWDAVITSEIVRHNTVFWATTISEAALHITRAKGFKYMLTQVTNSNNFHYLPDIIEYENTADIRNINRQYLNTISVL